MRSPELLYDRAAVGLHRVRLVLCMLVALCSAQHEFVLRVFPLFSRFRSILALSGCGVEATCALTSCMHGVAAVDATRACC